MEAMTSEREAFEKWIATAFPHIAAQVAKGLAPAARDAKEMAWAGWQAALSAQPAQAVDVELARKLIEIVRKQCGGYLSGPGHDALMVAKALDEALSGEKAGPVMDGAAKYKWICDQFNSMKTSTSERFLECLGIEGDVCKPLDDLLPASPAPGKEEE